MDARIPAEETTRDRLKEMPLPGVTYDEKLQALMDAYEEEANA